VSDRDYAQWWDAFAHEFFDENAHMSIIFTLEENGPPKRYSKCFIVSHTDKIYPFSAIGRTLIPRYFRTIFESGVKEMFYVLRNPSREYFTNVNTAVLECDGMLLVTKHDRPVYSEVNTDYGD
jgi:LIM domain-binding protein 1